MIKSKFGLHQNGWDTGIHSSVSYGSPLKFIHQCYPLFLPHTRYPVGNGEHIRFWEDVWIGQVSLQSAFPRLYRLSSVHSAPISDFLITGGSLDLSWHFHFFRHLNDQEAGEMVTLLDMLSQVQLSSHPDSRIWLLEGSGSFSCRSFHSHLIQLCISSPFLLSPSVWKARFPFNNFFLDSRAQ